MLIGINKEVTELLSLLHSDKSEHLNETLELLNDPSS